MNSSICELILKGGVTIEFKQYIVRYQVAFQRIYRSINTMIKQHVHTDITTDQFSILQFIYQHEQTTTTEIAQAFGVGKSAITAIVNRLVEKQLLFRERNEHDRRIVYLQLTTDGKNVIEKTEKEIHLFLNDKLSSFKLEEIENFLIALEKLSVLMEEENNEPKGGR